MDTTDHGPAPYVVDIERLTLENDNFRTTVWTNDHLQLTVMMIPVGGDIGLEVHPNTDQFIRIEQGHGKVEMGPDRENLNFVQEVQDGSASFVPAGTWHNVVNVGDTELKLYTLYGPKDHVAGTVHHTQQDAMNDPNEHQIID